MMQFLLIIMMATATASAKSVIHTSSAGTCAMVNNNVRCWGYNQDGQLGLGHSSPIYEPQDDAIDFGDFVPSVLDCGGTHCCVIDSDIHGVKCWGYNGQGQLGYGDTNNRGDGSGEMGNNLPLVELPSGFVPSKLAPQNGVTCVLSTEGEVVCFGRNDVGQLGIGHTNRIGDDSGEMGDNMDLVDVGTDFGVVTDLIAGAYYFQCALNSDGQVKCWGLNNNGQLGLGDTNNRGDGSNEMGDYLPYLQFGTGFILQSMDCGSKHCCVLSTENVFKCFGDGLYAQLGYGDTNDRGDSPNEMGDFLLALSLGSDFVIQEFRCGGNSNCAISTEGQLKCFGYNVYGGLGLGDTANRGDDNNEMGDYLPEVDVGSGFTASGMRIGEGTPGSFCIFEDSVSSDLELKCFGDNYYGQLGYGDTITRGAGSNEMGDYLPFVSFGEWPTAPTTAAPTSIPTSFPTVSPTEPLCDSASMTAVNWHDLLNSNEQETSLLQSYAVDFDASTLSLTLRATVQYIGQSADGNFDDDYNLGTTYWMDFQSFSTIDGGVDSAGSCGNRRSADYTDLSFEQFWEFPVNPADLDEMDTAERMAYPPSEWDLEAINCTVIEYERTLSWTELTACSDADGDVLVEITETDDAVLLEGTFFVELVSPYSSASDEYYRTFPLLQQGFRVALNREVNALSSTGVQLFIPSVMAYGLDDEGNYEVTVLVQSADYLMLGMDEESIASISSPLAVTGFETVNADCLVASSFTCGQIFTATIPASCTDEDSVIDLSGTYQFGFTPQCRILEDGSTDPACDVFMTTLDDAGKVVLEVDASFIDQCDVDLFEVTFDGDLAFFADDEFSVAVDDGSDPFVIGHDTIYGKVTVDIPDDESGAMYDFVSVSIENVYVCTAEDELSVDDESGFGGCLSPDIVDDDGPYTVIGSGAVADYLGTTDFDVAANNEAAFSFLTFDTARTTINVHVQLLLTLTTESGEVGRRRMLLQSGSDGEDENGNAFRSYIGTASVAEEETTADPVATDAGFARFSFGFIPAMLVVVIAFIMG